MTPAPTSNTVELLVDGHEILPAVLDDLRGARSTVHISVLLWFRDPLGEELADLLIQKARRRGLSRNRDPRTLLLISRASL